MSSLTFYMVRLYPAGKPIIQEEYKSLHAALADVRKEHNACPVVGHSLYDVRWSRDGKKLHKLPDAERFGYQVGDSVEDFETAILKGIEKTAVHS